MTYGIDADSDNDALITTFAAAMKGVVEEGSPGFCLVDLFPPRESPVMNTIGNVSNIFFSQILAILDARRGVSETCVKDSRLCE